MRERLYGANKALYGVVQSGNSIELRVYTKSAEMRDVLGRLGSDPSALLARAATYAGRRSVRSRGSRTS